MKDERINETVIEDGQSDQVSMKIKCKQTFTAEKQEFNCYLSIHIEWCY